MKEPRRLMPGYYGQGCEPLACYVKEGPETFSAYCISLNDLPVQTAYSKDEAVFLLEQYLSKFVRAAADRKGVLPWSSDHAYYLALGLSTMPHPTIQYFWLNISKGQA